MLRRLHIENFALIDTLNIEFCPKINVLTGETGAGKSLIIKAIKALSGDDVEKSYVSELNTCIEGLFEVSKTVCSLLSEKGYNDDGGAFIISRQYSQKTKNRFYINGRMAPRQVIQEIFPLLIDIHGQLTHSLITDSEYQLSIVDSFLPDTKKCQLVKKLYTKHSSLKRELNILREQELEMNRNRDMYAFQIEEIEKAELKEHEEEELRQEEEFEKRREDIYKANALFFDCVFESDEAVYKNISTVLSEFESMKDCSSNISAAADCLNRALIELDEARNTLNEMEISEESTSRVDEIQERLYLIQSLKRKYGYTVSDILQYLESIKEKIQDFSDIQLKIRETAKQCDQVLNELISASHELSKLRKKTVLSIEKDFDRYLQMLNMQDGKFHIHFLSENEKNDPGPSGIDQVQFMVDLNKKGMRPIAHIASGGELSRIILILKYLYSKYSPEISFLFDEIDTGIDGKTLKSVSELIRQFSNQLIIVTHMPHVAFTADRHFEIKKIKTGNNYSVQAIRLSTDQVAEQIAKMLGTDDSSAAQIIQSLIKS